MGTTAPGRPARGRGACPFPGLAVLLWALLAVQAGLPAHAQVGGGPAAVPELTVWDAVRQVERKARENLAAGVAQTEVTALTVRYPAGTVEAPPEAEPSIDALATALLVEPRMRRVAVEVQGHTGGALGDRASNDLLAFDRAQAFRNRLVDEYGIEPDRILRRALGATQLDPRFPPQAAEQRRVVVVLRVPSAAFARDPVPPLPAGLTLANFSAQSPHVRLPMGAPMATAVGQTLDFWVAAGWSDGAALKHDPTVVALRGLGGVRQSVHVTAARDGIAYWDGDPGNYAYDRVLFDFTDGAPHHVAIVSLGGSTDVWVDGVLRGRLDRGFGKVTASAVDLGGYDGDTARFVGRIGGLRLWAAALLPSEVAALPGVKGDPGPRFSAYDDLFATVSLEGGRHSLAEFAPVIEPFDGPWTTYGSDHITIHNKNAFDMGREAAQIYSEHLLEHVGKGARENSVTFSSYPLYVVDRQSADDVPDEPEIVGGPGGEAFSEPAPANGRLRRIEIASGYWIDSIQPFYEVDGRRVAGRRLGGPGGPTRTVIDLAPDERLLGLSGRTGARIGGLRVHTTRRVSDPIGLALPQADFGEDFRVWLPLDAPFGGFAGRASGALDAIGLIPGWDPRRAAVTIAQEDGRFARFEQVDRNTYRSVEASTGLTPVQWPTLRVESEEIIRVDGIERDLAPITAHDEPSPEDAFDNTFVAQAKAVNLSANYQGYDAAFMDPLHLVRTGSAKRVFAMPGHGSTDYHDYNRIFVPNGLLYVPEFTGRTQVATATANSTESYKDAFSQTVGLKGDVFGAKFGFSETMKEAHETIQQQQKSMTISVAKSAFYDLVLDKARIRLDDEFRGRVMRLKEQGDYRGFVEVFGTHYPQAVVYGGMGVMQMEYTSEMLSRLREKGVDIKVEAGAKAEEASGSVSYSSSSSTSQGFKDEMGRQLENFYWIGGNHAGATKESWSVGVDGAVPVYVALRPLHELLAPPFFADPDIVNRVRPALERETENYLRAMAALQPKGEADLPRFYEVELTKLTVGDLGDDDLPPFDDTLDLAGVLRNSPDARVQELKGAGKAFFDRIIFLKKGPENSALFARAPEDPTFESRVKRFAVPPAVVGGGGGIAIEAPRMTELDEGANPNDELGLKQPSLIAAWRDIGRNRTERELPFEQCGQILNRPSCTKFTFTFTLRELGAGNLLGIE